jgi:hypothetical protein
LFEASGRALRESSTLNLLDELVRRWAITLSVSHFNTLLIYS